MPALNTCRRCGAELNSQDDQENCPSCLMNLALDEEEETRVSTKRQVRTLGDYEIIRQIGRGGMGIVFLARRIGEDTPVALKMLREEITSPIVEERIKKEVETAATLDHPNIIPICDVGDVDGQCYFTMKLIEGTTLDQEIGYKGFHVEGTSRDEPPSQEAQKSIVQLLIRIARAVHHAHKRNIIHRDLKPSNILLNKTGEPYLTDFGLAKFIDDEAQSRDSSTRNRLTMTGEVLGTLEYMSPEQATGKNHQLNSATDIYSLGIMLYKMLTGRTPFARGLTPVEIIKHVTETPAEDPRTINPHVDRDLSSICLKCLEKHPGRRYVTAEALADDLERWLKRERVLARPPSQLRRFVQWTRKHPISSSAMLFLLVLLGAVVAFTGVILKQKNDQEIITNNYRQGWHRDLDHEWANTKEPYWDLKSDQIAMWNGQVPVIPPPGVTPTNLTFAVYSWKKPTKMLQIFAPVLSHLEKAMEKRLGNPVIIDFRIYRTYDDGQRALAENDIAFARLSPATYVELKEQHPGISLLLMENGKGGSCLFVAGNSSATSLAALKGGKLGLVDNSSTSGNYLPKYMLLNAGLTAKDFKCAGTNYLNAHDAVVEAVLKGKVTAGAANRKVVQEYIDNGHHLVMLEEYLLQVGKPWVASPGLDSAVAKAIRASLREISDSDVLTALGNNTSGFDEINDPQYDNLRKAMKASAEFGQFGAGEKELKLVLNQAGYTNLLAVLETKGYGPKNSTYQTNYYFDTPEMDLRKMGVNLRFRIKESKAIVTVKFNPTRLSGLSSASQGIAENVEYEAVFKDGLGTATRILIGELNLIDAATEAICPKTQKSNLHPITFLTTQILPGVNSLPRNANASTTNAPIKANEIAQRAQNATLRNAYQFPAAGLKLNLDLDKTTFPDHFQGYELELEFPPDSDANTVARVRRDLDQLLGNLFIPIKFSKLGKTATTFLILEGDETEIRELETYGQIGRR